MQQMNLDKHKIKYKMWIIKYKKNKNKNVFNVKIYLFYHLKKVNLIKN